MSRILADTERIPLAFHAASAEDAIAQATAWVKAEPNLRLRTIASCRPSGQPGGNWAVTVAVNVLARPETPARLAE